MHVRDAFYELLRAHGIDTIFGNPGSNELPMLRDLPDDFRYVLALHEGAAMAMADGYALATGRPAILNLHAAAGTGNAMGNLTNTQAGNVPVVVTSGQQARRYAALNAMLTNVDAPSLAEPLVKWSAEPLRAQDVPQALSNGLLLADTAPRGPVYISLPLDDWDEEAETSSLDQLTSRRVLGDPVIADDALRLLADRFAQATNPLMILGPGVDTPTGWDAAVRLSELQQLPVHIAPSPSRCPFPTRHPNYQGILPSDVPGVAQRLDGHDLVVVFGASIFRYHVFAPGDYLTPGVEVWGVTSDPQAAARAPFGRLLVGDPADALRRLAGVVGPSERAAPTSAPPAALVDEGGPRFSADAILDALDAAKDADTVVVNEWTSVDVAWDRLDISRSGSMYFPAAGGLGWGLPAAIGLQLGDPSRRVLAMLGDGAVHYTISALWTAAQYDVPVVFVVARNEEYGALRNFTREMDATGVPGLDLPGLDIPSIATAYGVAASRVDSLGDLTDTVRRALASNRPSLIEIPERQLPT